jgi:hypothetical protein
LILYAHQDSSAEPPVLPEKEAVNPVVDLAVMFTARAFEAVFDGS